MKINFLDFQFCCSNFFLIFVLFLFCNLTVRILLTIIEKKFNFYLKNQLTKTNKSFLSSLQKYCSTFIHKGNNEYKSIKKIKFICHLIGYYFVHNKSNDFKIKNISQVYSSFRTQIIFSQTPQKCFRQVSVGAITSKVEKKGKLLVY